MRTVFVGTEANPYRLRLADIPADRDLSFSFWRWVDFSGRNFPNFNMTDMDIINCDGRNAYLSNSIGGLTSRRTNWRGARIPPNVSSAQHDLVAEVMRANAGTDPELQQLAQVVNDYLRGDYTRSWADAFPYVRQQMGWTNTEPGSNLTKLRAILDGYPNILRRLIQNAKASAWGSTPGGAFTTDLSAVPVYSANRTVDLRPYRDLATLDRWAFARSLELVFPDTKFYIKRLEPTPVVLAMDANFAVGSWWLNITNVADL